MKYRNLIVDIGTILSLTGWGIAAHDFAHQVYQLKGTVLSLEGGYVGLALCLIGIILLILRLEQERIEKSD